MCRQNRRNGAALRRTRAFNGNRKNRPTIEPKLIEFFSVQPFKYEARSPRPTGRQKSIFSAAAAAAVVAVSDSRDYRTSGRYSQRARLRHQPASASRRRHTPAVYSDPGMRMIRFSTGQKLCYCCYYKNTSDFGPPTKRRRI